MAIPEHLAILRQGVKTSNAWRLSDEETTPDLSNETLQDLTLRHADLHGANLSNSDLSQVDLCYAKLNEATLNHTDFSYSLLSQVNFSYSSLIGADLSRTDLIRANCRSVILSGSDLSYSLLRYANLENADLTNANLTYTDLDHANLANVDLRQARLQQSNISGTDFSRSTFAGTLLCGVDCSQAKGLDTADHFGPSTIGIDTLYKSNGRIPEPFLRGAGVSDQFIVYAKSLICSAIEFYSCFISYSTKDQEFAERLHLDLQAKGIRCWFAPHDVQGGRKLHEQLDEAIRLHDKLLLILSPASMASEWVKTEISKARKREVRDGARVLFPITLAPFEAIRDWECFDADSGNDSAREIREYYVPDFSNWKDHDSYKKAFQRLVKDLQAPAQAPSA